MELRKMINNSSPPKAVFLATFCLQFIFFSVSAFGNTLSEKSSDPAEPSARRPTIGTREISFTDLCTPIAPTDSYSPRQAAFAALCRSARVRASMESLNGLVSKLGVANSAHFPTVSLVTNNSKRATSSFSTQGRPEFSVTGDSELVKKQAINLSWAIFTSGAISTAVNGASLNVQVAAWELQGQVDSVLVEALSAHYELYYSTRLVEIYQRGFELAEQTVEIANRRLRGGVGTRSEVLLAETSLVRADIELQRVKEQMRSKEITWAGLLGIDREQLKPPSVQQRLISDLAPIESLMGSLGNGEHTAESRPAYRAAILKYESARSGIDQAIREGLPSANLNMAYGNQNLRNRGIISQNGIEKSVALTFNIPIFDGNGRFHKIRESVSNAEALLQQAQGVKRDLLAEHNQSVSAIKQEIALRRTVNNYLRLSTESQAAVLQRYRKGLAEMSELVNSQREFVTASAEFNNWALRYILARIKLQRDLNGLEAELVY
jgi:outer membrane protein